MLENLLTSGNTCFSVESELSHKLVDCTHVCDMGNVSHECSFSVEYLYCLWLKLPGNK